MIGASHEGCLQLDGALVDNLEEVSVVLLPVDVLATGAAHRLDIFLDLDESY